jgi:hypothetical protein
VWNWYLFSGFCFAPTIQFNTGYFINQQDYQKEIARLAAECTNGFETRPEG